MRRDARRVWQVSLGLTGGELRIGTSRSLGRKVADVVCPLTQQCGSHMPMLDIAKQSLGSGRKEQKMFKIESLHQARSL